MSVRMHWLVSKASCWVVLATGCLSAPVAAFAASTARADADRPGFQELEESLTCQCGCGLTVHSCNHVDCGSAIPLRKEIREQMAEGKSKEQILQYFVDKYGEKILSSPVARGFNLLAWAMPFVALSLGGLGLFALLRRWGRAAGHTSVRNPTPADHDRYRQTVEKELERLDEF